MIRAVVFDAVGTLIHPIPGVGEVYAQRAESEPSLMARGIYGAAARRMFERT